MIIKVYVECMCNYDYLFHAENSLDLYNSLVINNLLEESEHNIIMCAYWYRELSISFSAINHEVTHGNKVRFTMGKYNSEILENLYK